MAHNTDEDGRHLPDDPNLMEELVKQVVASAAPHPNLPPIPYSLHKMKNFLIRLVSFKGPRSYDWSAEPGITPLQIEALHEIERLFLESRAFYKLLHEIYKTWREHRVEPTPSEGLYFKAVTPKEQISFDDAHPLFKVFWGLQEGTLTWSGEDVIPVMRELVNNLLGREAVSVIPAVVVIAEEANSVPNGNVEAVEPDGADAEVENEHRKPKCDIDGNGDKENQQASGTSFLVSDLLDMVVDHEEEVETTSFETPKAESSRKRRRRGTKSGSDTPTRKRQAKTAKIGSEATDKDGDDCQDSAKNPVSVDLANQDRLVEVAVRTNVSVEEPISGNTNIGSAGSQTVRDSGAKISQGRTETEQVTGQIILDLVKSLIDLAVRDEEEGERLQEVQAVEPPAEAQAALRIFDEMDFNEPENNSSQSPSSGAQEVQEVQTDHVIFDDMEFDMPESYVTALVPSSVELAPIRRHLAPLQALPQPGQFFVIRNVLQMNKEKRRLVKSFAKHPPIRQGTFEYNKLLEYAQNVFDNSGVLENNELVSIISFLRRYICDPFEELEGDFPRNKIIIAPHAKKMFLKFQKTQGKSRSRSDRLYTQWRNSLNPNYLLWVRLKEIVDELIFLQVQSRVIIGEPERRTGKKEKPKEVVVVDLEKDEDDNEPPAKRQCFWMS